MNLRRAIDEALAFGASAAEVFARDGEGFDALVVKATDAEMFASEAPYYDESIWNAPPAAPWDARGIDRAEAIAAGKTIAEVYGAESPYEPPQVDSMHREAVFLDVARRHSARTVDGAHLFSQAQLMDFVRALPDDVLMRLRADAPVVEEATSGTNS
ncbi:hypothetical protein F6X40_35290 [Paraburkholderia sp. UCT31]|uniref:hypothetical protein n=1 Tax=Paraburkholderia sp. UCT31 TaxID=2615209 RepID=UPI0016561207|nr:hypothetical protein [Paraburkholderia sp. UCT31]MBC8741815.1 hypothetical protein [Paraburkholderia sp. UCT31]